MDSGEGRGWLAYTPDGHYDAPPGAEKLVDGFTAIDLDTVNYIISRTPIAIIYIVGKIWSWWFSTHDGRRDRE